MLYWYDYYKVPPSLPSTMSIRNHTISRLDENCAHLKKPRSAPKLLLLYHFHTYTCVLSRHLFSLAGGAADDRERSRRSAGTRRAEITAEREFTEHGARSFSVFSRYAFVEREALVGDGGEGVGDGVDNFRAEVGEALSRARCNVVVVGIIIIILIERGGDGGGKE